MKSLLLFYLLFLLVRLDCSHGNGRHIADGYVADGYQGDGAAHGGYMADGWGSKGGSSDWQLESRLGTQSKCVDIPSNMSLCAGIGYKTMRLPNLLEHDTLLEATQQSTSWVPLLGIHCHANTKLFLCSLFSPVCLDRPIYPCRTLCEAVKAGCAKRMIQYGFPWPEMLRCDKFPPPNDLCIGVQNNEEEAKTESSVCPSCKAPDTFEGVVDSYCHSEFALRIKLKKNVISKGDIKLKGSRKKKIFKRGSLTKKDFRRMTFHITGGATCECSRLESPRKSPALLVMGHRRGGKLELSFVQQIQGRKFKVLRRALRRLQTRTDLCKGGAQVLADGVMMREEAYKERPKYRSRKRKRSKQAAKKRKTD